MRSQVKFLFRFQSAKSHDMEDNTYLVDYYDWFVFYRLSTLCGLLFFYE